MSINNSEVSKFYFSKQFSSLLEGKKNQESVRGTKVSGTVLSATEFRDLLCARYNAPPLDPQIHCDGCGTEFGVTHTLRCSTGSLVIARHKKIREKSSIYPGVTSPQHQYAPNP